MDTKLTLKLDSKAIMQAKIYARKRKTSLSKLIENYFGLLTDPSKENEVTPFVKSLSGIIDLPKDYDYKKSYKEHILKKYSK